LVGYLAALGAIAMWLPQVARALRNRTNPAYLEAISTSTYAVGLAFNALLIAYGVLSDSIPAIAAGIVNIACSATIITLKVRA
jgi:uncharacterized protein with PQ loop repeat